jgi:hypothetical protein
VITGAFEMETQESPQPRIVVHNEKMQPVVHATGKPLHHATPIERH